MQIECAPARGVNVRETGTKEINIDPGFIAATTVIGDKVKGKDGKEIGKIEEIMFDLTCGSVTYLVLSTGGVLGIGDKFFAIPLDVMTMDKEEKTFYVDLDKKWLKKHPGFDKNDWPKKAVWPLTR
jgi:sporulation protein YlmC with PRC-barrel domain